MERFTVRVLTLLTDAAQPFDFDLPPQGGGLAAVDNLHLKGYDGISSSLLISLTAHADSVASAMDHAAAHSGTSGSTSQRLYWIGDTPSRWVRARLWRDARHVDWRLSFHPTRLKELSISARVDCIRCLPGSLEAAFGYPLRGDG